MIPAAADDMTLDRLAAPYNKVDLTPRPTGSIELSNNPETACNDDEQDDTRSQFDFVSFYYSSLFTVSGLIDIATLANRDKHSFILCVSALSSSPAVFDTALARVKSRLDQLVDVVATLPLPSVQPTFPSPFLRTSLFFP